MEADQILDAAAWVGRQQAFALIASKCSSAQAECLRQIKDTAAHEQLGLTWEEFCTQRAGISRRYAEALIGRLAEFGDTYFKLSQLARVSPDTYRQIAGLVHDDVIEIDGQPIALIPENAPRIRAGIQRLQARLREPKPPTHHSVVELQMRLEAILREVSDRAARPLPMGELAALRGMCIFAINKWRARSKVLEAAKPA
jgi:hypothetical protein